MEQLLVLDDKTLEILFNVVNTITETEIQILKNRDKDFKYSINEYENAFQEIFDKIIDIKGEC